MAELNQLKLKRGQQRAVLTRTRKFLQGLDDVSLTANIKLEIELRLQKLNVAFESFNEIQDKIEIIEESTEGDERDDFECLYYSLCAQCKELVGTSSSSDVGSENSQPQGNQTIIQNPPFSPYIIPQVHLPISELPKFNGEYDSWVEFRDSFLALVDRNQIISNVQKFHYLKTCLSPNALDSIKSIKVTAENYPLAWSTLQDRYEKSQLIKQSHVKAILNIPPLNKESNVNLRKLCYEITNNLESLRNLNEPVDQWDTLLLPIIVEKLDVSSRKEWEKYSTLHDVYSVKDLFKVLTSRCDILEKLEGTKTPATKPYAKVKTQNFSVFSTPKVTRKCPVCTEDHPIYYCSVFRKMSSSQKQHEVRKHKLCTNCLNTHSRLQCKSLSKCRICGRSHNTLLHMETPQNKINAAEVCSDNVENQQRSTIPKSTEVDILHTLSKTTVMKSSESPSLKQETQALLSTVTVLIKDSTGNVYECRALLDNGAMSNFITRRLKERLELESSPINITFSGIGQHSQGSEEMVRVTIKSKFNRFSNVIDCLVIDNITSNIPTISFPTKNFKLPPNIKLADPEFHVSKPIDLLLGGSVFWKILRPYKRHIPNTEIILQDTELGWIVGGSIGIPNISGTRNYLGINCLSVNERLEQHLRKFWQIEQVPEVDNRSVSNNVCEVHFQKTIKRAADGHFIVTIPFKDNVKQLGESRLLAQKRFYSLEKKLLKDLQLRKEYSDFIKEYIYLNQMVPIQETSGKEELNFYIPHHCVIRPESLTTKLRVVFDASMKSDNGLSLNDVQHPGPAIQNDLTSLLLRFRTYAFVLTADISKMYRAIWLDPQQTRFHRVFWRNSPSDKLQCYELQTLTYGTASAPFLAIRCLHQLAQENQNLYPKAAAAIRNCFYVDDFVFGAQTEEELIQVQRDVNKILKEAGFYLRKWLTNHDSLYRKLDLNRELTCSTLGFDKKETTKTLGVAWNADGDIFLYVASNLKQHSKITKRSILSEVAQIFDPLGIVAPVVLVGKLLMQTLWQQKVDWNDTVSESLSIQWKRFQNDIQELATIEVPRHVILSNAVEIELHGFGDASEKAYGAAIYLVSRAKGEVMVNLLCSRSRVAPLKRQTLPRLELCAAMLVAQLASKIKQILDLNINRCNYWSDSSVTLCWIRSCPSKWKTFVANRVAEIQRLTQIEEWNFVTSKENPADILSRGCPITELKNNSLWWNGPAWLKDRAYSVTTGVNDPEEAFQESKGIVCINVQTVLPDVVTRFSKLSRLSRAIAYCFRFVHNCKTSKSLRSVGPLEVEEIKRALASVLALEQRRFFPKEHKAIAEHRTIHSDSSLSSLNPFLDKKGLLRVGGRIKNNNYLPYNKKYPVILPKDSKLTNLIFKDIHEKYFHCGATQLIHGVRETYWPISGQSLAKRLVRNCRICFLARPRNLQYKMGNLPTARISQCLPFTHVGLDYAGPFQLKDRSTRNAKLVKGYICLFICFTTKAIHLEVVSDLSTNSFIACLRRFISRRGKPAHLYSDNAKTFKGANAEIKRVHTFLQNQKDSIYNFLGTEQITWHFVPPRAPNFGGLWEAGVKCVKFHLKRVLRNTKLTYEDFSTVLCQIESILNSRPLCPLTANSDNIDPLTPGHFLILKPPMTIPDEELLTKIPESKLKHFAQLQKLTQTFWQRWHKEYISELQRRVKWKKSDPNQPQLTPGTMVLVKEDNVPVMQWPLARVVEVHPGPDAIVRVATLKFNDGVRRRPTSKLCVLPIDQQES